VLHIYYGPDTYSRAEAIAELKARLNADGMLPANTLEFDGKALPFEELLATCDTVPFLAEHRLVLVIDLLQQPRQQRGRTARRGPPEGRAGSTIDRLVDYLPRMPETTQLLLLEGEAINRDALAQLQPLGEVRHFPLKDERQLQEWIAARARRGALKLEPGAVQSLARSVHGADLWALSNEIDKLALWAGEQTVSGADVRRLVAAAQESNIFAMVDAIIAGRLGSALAQLSLLQRDGAPAPYLLTMIARQYRQLIVVEDLTSAGESTATIAREAGIRSENVVQRLAQQARRLGADRLRSAFERILQADIAIKRGEMAEGLAVELLVTDLSNGEFKKPPVFRVLS
jgi:DNA polymerase-3 subunit delta